MSLPCAAIAQPPNPEPPPRLEASAQFTLLVTTGNATAEALGAGGELYWRPMPWVLKVKTTFAQTESDDVLDARSLVSLFRADRFVTTRTSFYSQYGNTMTPTRFEIGRNATATHWQV